VKGNLQEVNFDTFASIVAWSTVLTFVVTSLTLAWPTCSIDFDNAFVQAMPTGYAQRPYLGTPSTRFQVGL
jgi:hypothetical protein